MGSQPVGWMLAVQGCLGHAGDALSRGCFQVVALQDGGIVWIARAGWGGHVSRHCIEDESSNNKSRIVGQTWLIPTLLHPSPLAQPSPTIPQPTMSSSRPAVPTPWIICRFPTPLPGL